MIRERAEGRSLSPQLAEQAHDAARITRQQVVYPECALPYPLQQVFRSQRVRERTNPQVLGLKGRERCALSVASVSRGQHELDPCEGRKRYGGERGCRFEESAEAHRRE